MLTAIGRRTFCGLAILAALTLVPLAHGTAAASNAAPLMSVEQTGTTMRAYLDALLADGDFGAYFADDIVVTMVDSGDEVMGREAAVQAITYLHQVTFTAHLEIKSLVVGEGVAALEAVFVGTQTGEFAGIPATGRAVRLDYSVFYELTDGKITTLRIYELVDGLLRQLHTPVAPSEDPRGNGRPR
jgi:predicted ester cyclase